MSARRRESKGAAATSAAHSAAKRKSAAVELSADVEARVRSTLADLGVSPSNAATAGGRLDAEEVAALYDSLLMEEFQQEHVQQALQALAGSDMSQEAALDWLCLHVDPAELPRRFAGNARSRASAAGIKVLAKAEKRDPSERAQPEIIFEVPKPSAAKKDPKVDRAKTEKEKQSQRDWILQYMEQEDSSDDGNDKADDVVEDWEVWGDPREIERRKAERKRSNLPLEERRQLLADEWVHAKSEAAKAKAAADKPRQKAAGSVIRDLKLEMKQLGLTEEAAESMAEPVQSSRNGNADAAWDDDGSWPSLGAPAEGSNALEAKAKLSEPSAGPELEPESSSRQGADSEAAGVEEGKDFAEDNGSMLSFPDPSTPGDGQLPAEVPPEGVGNGGTVAEQASSSGADQKSEDEADNIEGGMSLFDEEAKQEWEANTNPGVPKPPKPTVQPWGLVQKQGAKKKGLKARPVEPVIETKAPKALLQQLCQRELRGPLRFERLSLGGSRLATAGMRYSVTVLNPPQKGGGKKKATPKQRTFALREEDDGWETIQDAQNAAATLALYHLSSDKAVWHSLPLTFQDLWLAWDAQSSHPASDQAADAADKLSFVESLVALSATAKPGPATEATQPLETDAQMSSNGAVNLPAARPQAMSRATIEIGRQLQDALARFHASAEGRRWREQREALPVVGIRDDLLAALATNDVAVVSGDTGCGKTTQVPQYLLDADIEAGRGGSCSIICTQPRRIAAISVAERVCQEREEPPPGSPGSLVGYHVRLDAAATKATRLLFCTTGILLRRLASDPTLASTSHIIVDEVHERTVQGDFLMALLKDIVAQRRQQGNPLKVVLMSATLDSALFARYFGGCPALAAGGHTFPVEHRFLEDMYEMTGYRLDTEGPAALRQHSDGSKRKALQKATGSRQGLVKAGWGDDEADGVVLNSHFDPELYTAYSSSTRKNLARVDENRIDYDLLEEFLLHIDSQAEEGAILVFLPGMGEINSMYERLTASRGYREGKQWVLPLHSSVSPQEQRRAFEVPPSGVRKIVLATNIAETSLTISDVSYVVDSGKLKERRYDASRGMSLLVEDWVSRANALQRKGRAGRVRAGQCFGLYTRHRFESRMRPFQAPEIVRIPLEELVLQIQLLGLGPAAAFLNKVIEPPPPRSIAAAVSNLQSVGALTASEELTPMGHHLAQLPVDARVGKLLLLAASLGCVSPALTIAACLSYRPPFSAPFDQQDAAQRIKLALAAPGSGNLASGQQSDHLIMAAAYQGWAQATAKGGKREGAAYARKHMLSQQTLEMLADMRWQFGSMLADSKFVTSPGRGRGAGAKQHAWLDDPAQSWNKQAGQASLVKAVLCAALYPNVAVMDDGAGKSARPAWNDGTGEVFIHPSSINHMLEARQFQRPYLAYLEKVKTSRTFLRDCTVTSPMALLLFGGALEVVHQEGYVLIDGWIRVRAAAPTAVLVKNLRRALDALLEKKIARPELDLSTIGGDLVNTLVAILDQERWDK